MLVIHQNNTNHHYKYVDPKILDPFKIFADELVLIILSYLDFNSLGKACLVNKNWKRIASDQSLWKKADFYAKAINNKKWAKWFGTDIINNESFEEDWNSLPWNIAGILESPCPIFPEKKLSDTHLLVWLPKTFNGKLNLENLEKLKKKFFSINGIVCKCIWSNATQKQINNPINKSYWILMTKDVLPESRNKTYAEQLKIVEELSAKSLINYQVPKVLEAVTCILSYYFDSNTRLYSDKPWTYTRCEDQIKNFPIAVGGFEANGFYVGQYIMDCRNVGVAALRKL